MKILIFGGRGMLGHNLVSHLSGIGHDVWVTTRDRNYLLDRLGIISRMKILANVDVTKYPIHMLIDRIQPNVVINAVGLLQHLGQEIDHEQKLAMIQVNALFPNILARECIKRKIRLIQISTDCVFSGVDGNYTEDDTPDSTSAYGRTKQLGEIIAENCITLRTSFIGGEIDHYTNLLEWFLRQEGGIQGYTRAYFSGLTTNEFSKVIAYIIETNIPDGLYHVAGRRISKYLLLCLFKDIFEKDIEIIPNDEIRIDRSLNGSRFEKVAGYTVPSWEEMLVELVDEQCKAIEPGL